MKIKGKKFPYFRVSVFAYSDKDQQILDNMFDHFVKKDMPCFIISHVGQWGKKKKKIFTLWRMGDESNTIEADRNSEPLPEGYQLVRSHQINEEELGG